MALSSNAVGSAIEELYKSNASDRIVRVVLETLNTIIVEDGCEAKISELKEELAVTLLKVKGLKAETLAEALQLASNFVS